MSKENAVELTNDKRQPSIFTDHLNKTRAREVIDSHIHQSHVYLQAWHDVYKCMKPRTANRISCTIHAELSMGIRHQ